MPIATDPVGAEWTKAAFDTRASHGPIHRTGYTRGHFGIARDGDWTIFHLPTGMMFIYSCWSTLREAKRFADALAGKSEWDDKKLDRCPGKFYRACDEIADEFGIERQRMRAIL